jgi:hypothetical protein
MFINVLKMTGATLLLIMVFYYLTGALSMFGEEIKALGGVVSLGLIIYLWIKAYQRIFKKEVKKV